MAVDSPVLINDWWVYLRDSMGSSHLNPNDYQIHNATKIWNELKAQGYSDAAAAGILGNMQTESGLSPGAIGGHLSQLPNNGQHLSDLPNSVMLEYYNHSKPSQKGYPVGLIQWDSYTNTAPAGCTIVSFAERYNQDWYDGDIQMYRLQREFETDSTYHYWDPSLLSTPMSWAEFKNYNGTPERAADIFRVARERSSGDATGNQNRRDNARFWYEYFTGQPSPDPDPQPTPPDPPDPGPDPEPPSLDDWVWGEDWANMVVQNFDPDITGVQIPYSQMDCMKFVDEAWKLLNVVDVNGYTLGTGTNRLWRSTDAYPTASPTDPTPPTPELWYKSTIDNFIAHEDKLPIGCLLFHKIPDAGPPAIPPQYAGDGIGNFAHIGIYIGNNEVMQSGGRDAASVPGGGVHRSRYDASAWNYLAYVCYVEPTLQPYVPPEINVVDFLTLWYATRKKEVLKRVKRTI